MHPSLVDREIAVLIADDDPSVRLFMARALIDAGFRVLESSNSHEAAAKIQSHPSGVDLVVADIRMPGGSGLDLGVDLSANNSNTDVLYVSGLIDSIAVESLRLRDPWAILTKPFTASVLVERVRNVLAARALRLARSSEVPPRAESPSENIQSG